MASPTFTARTAPVGKRLKRGHKTVLAFARDPDVSLWEVTVALPGYEGGDPIDITTMHNLIYRQFHPQALITCTPFQITFGYDDSLISQLENLINQPGAITAHLPNTARVAFWGFMQNITFDPLAGAEFPTGSATIVPTNTDPSDDSEAGPVLSPITGT